MCACTFIKSKGLIQERDTQLQALPLFRVAAATVLQRFLSKFPVIIPVPSTRSFLSFRLRLQAPLQSTRGVVGFRKSQTFFPPLTSTSDHSARELLISYIGAPHHLSFAYYHPSQPDLFSLPEYLRLI